MSTRTETTTAERLRNAAHRAHITSVVLGRLRAIADAGLCAQNAPRGARLLVVSANPDRRAPRFEGTRGTLRGDSAGDAYRDLDVEPESSIDIIWERRQREGRCEYVLDLRRNWLTTLEKQSQAVNIDLDEL